MGYLNNSNQKINSLKPPLRIVFSTLISVFGYPGETMSLAFDILLIKKFENKDVS